MAVHPARSFFAGLSGSLAGGGATYAGNVAKENANKEAEFNARFKQRQQDYGEAFQTEGKVADIMGKNDEILAGLAEEAAKNKSGLAETGQREVGATARGANQNLTSLSNTTTTATQADRASLRRYRADMARTRAEARRTSNEEANRTIAGRSATLRGTVQSMRERGLIAIRNRGLDAETEKKQTEQLDGFLRRYSEIEAKRAADAVRDVYNTQSIHGNMTKSQYETTLQEFREQGLAPIHTQSPREETKELSEAKSEGYSLGNTKTAALAANLGLGDIGSSRGGGGSSSRAARDNLIAQVTQHINSSKAALGTGTRLDKQTAYNENNAFFFQHDGKMKSQFSSMNENDLRTITNLQSALRDRLDKE